MTSFGAEAEMEQYSENHVELASSCGTPQLAYGNSTKDHSHDQKFMERESPDSPSPVKRWEIGQLLQSFKSKMASFTEIVMSPVRLFKPTDTLSSIVHPDRLIESKEESSTWTEEGETTDDECKNGLLSKRLSSERVQCNSSPKRRRVAQRLNFETVSTSNHEPVLECNEVCDDVRVAHKENNQTDRPSSQLRTVLHNGNYPRPTTQSTFLNSDSIPSPEKMSNSTHDLHRSSHANSNTACGDSSESDAVFADSTVKNTRNKLNSSNTSPDFLLKDEDRSRIEESSALALRKSPRKVFKHTSETAADLASSASGPNSLNDRMKDLHSINVTEQMHRSTDVSDPPKSTSVVHVRSKRCREALRTETQKHMVAKRKRQARKAEDRGLRRAKNKNDSSITFEENQEDIVCVQLRKKRQDISTAQKLNTSNIADVEIRNSDTSESCDSTEIGQEKTVKTNLRKTIKCKSLLASSNEGDCDIASQNATGKVDKSLHHRNMNTMNDCNYESRPPDPSEFQKHKGEKTRARKTRHVFKTAGEVSFQKRRLRPPKHKFEDYSTTSVVDPAGPSGPSKRTLFQSDRPCGESQMTFIAGEEQMTSVCGPEARENKKRLTSPPLHPESTVSLQSERSPNRPTKTVNRPKRKQRENVIGAKDEAKIPEKMLEAISVESSSGSGSNRLLRSYSCPELPFLVFSGCNVPPSHTHENGSTSPTKKSMAVPLPSHLHSPSKRTRRHTVCSVEIDREIAPLCLRKEVYPASRGAPSSPYFPSNYLTALASCFLSSPLAFLSKSSSHRRGSAHSDASCFTSGYVTSSSPSLCSSPFASTLTSSDPVTDPSTVVTPSPEIPSASVSSICSSSQSALEGDHEILQMECRRAMDEEERSSFSLSISEEKALSDSEIKTDNKEGQERRGKVSSIRICKKIPKPQNNLTPMGLPKVIRIKKKDFSVEEIYTNKNFSKPPDGRLETIFEVALNRRDGSQVVVGQKKVKRFVEFPELGVVRKPKKPLVGGTAAQRKAGGNAAICRTRRGLGVSSKVEDGLTVQELDSLLCSKLQELDTWMALQQIAC
ncbi:uncharacterized protein prr14 [Triplophysa rosa]|uniref:uncharacterized protein prr14 n=1 Tax=Triplophysa rosa TaxID=992332 RepID=UPI002545D593|nr:uncharacterized protein prr14 [Triplophysa rosa]XP_057201788.1 uncharacterized protein prr14 [Triplophysa rosa]